MPKVNKPRHLSEPDDAPQNPSLLEPTEDQKLDAVYAEIENGVHDVERKSPALEAARRRSDVEQLRPENLRKGQAKPADPRPKKQELGFVQLSEVAQKLNVMWYGREGTGKTTHAASMANLGPVLYINAEGGLISEALEGHGIDISNIRVWPRPGEKLSFDGLEEWAFRLASDLQDDPDSWAGAVFDSMTEIHKALLEDITAKAVRKAERQGKDRDRWFVDRADWGVMTEQVRLLIRRFRDLPCHFGVTALERRDVDEDTGRVAYGPAVNPGLQTDLLGYVSMVLYTKTDALEATDKEEDDAVFRALCQPRGKYRAKDRSGSLPPVLVNPRFDRILLYAHGGLLEVDDPVQQVLANRPKEQTKETKKEAGDDNA